MSLWQEILHIANRYGGLILLEHENGNLHAHSRWVVKYRLKFLFPSRFLLRFDAESMVHKLLPKASVRLSLAKYFFTAYFYFFSCQWWPIGFVTHEGHEIFSIVTSSLTLWSQIIKHKFQNYDTFVCSFGSGLVDGDWRIISGAPNDRISWMP